MLAALLRASAALFAGPVRRIVYLSFTFAVASFALLWVATAALLYESPLFAWRPLAWLVDLLGGFAVLAVSWLLFPAMLTLCMSLFLDRVAAAVEALDFPGRGPPRRRFAGETIKSALWIVAITLLFNLLVLPLHLLFPGMNLLLFLAVNGYLLGRGYFEIVALRWLDAAAAKRVRNRFGGRVYLGGVVIAGLFALPFINLIAPVIATAFMVHVFEGLVQREPVLLKS
jgi:CysZ protein